jgi:hypothetical protein
MLKLVLCQLQACDNGYGSRYMRSQVPDSAENLRLADHHSSPVGRMELSSAQSAEVISMTDTCAAPDLFLDILNGFS